MISGCGLGSVCFELFCWLVWLFICFMVLIVFFFVEVDCILKISFGNLVLDLFNFLLVKLGCYKFLGVCKMIVF